MSETEYLKRIVMLWEITPSGDLPIGRMAYWRALDHKNQDAFRAAREGREPKQFRITDK